MKKIISFCFLVVALLFAGCVTKGAVKANSTAEIPSLQQKYAQRFEMTRIGMGLAEFKQVWPEAIKSGEAVEFVVYEFRESTKYYTDDDYNVGFWWTGSVTAHEFIQTELFYFTNDKLVKYEYRPGTSGI
jgi:hypothetical protein